MSCPLSRLRERVGVRATSASRADGLGFSSFRRVTNCSPRCQNDRSIKTRAARNMNRRLASPLPRRALVALLASAGAAVAQAQAPAPAAPARAVPPMATPATATVFPIRGFVIEGENPLGEAESNRALAPFVRPDATLETLQQATAALEAALRAAGY